MNRHGIVAAPGSAPLQPAAIRVDSKVRYEYPGTTQKYSHCFPPSCVHLMMTAKINWAAVRLRCHHGICSAPSLALPHSAVRLVVSDGLSASPLVLVLVATIRSGTNN
eukprot:scaffold148224_cov36-Prasinocladus_malaysianus.AAC.4